MDKLKIKPQTFTKSKLKTVGFTLVELIIVITILAILATIAFISFKNYSSNARDGNRMTTLKNIETGLLLFQTKTSSLPSPENYINIIGSGSSLLSKQGYIGKNITSQIRLNADVFDPKDNTQYLYSTNGANSKYQLGTYLEEQKLASYFPQTYANVDYSKRFFYTIGNPVGIILDEHNSPLSITTDLILDDNNTNFKVHFSNDSSSGSVTGTGGSLIEKMTEYQKNNSIPVMQNNCSFSGATILHGNPITLYKLESIDKFDSINTCENNSLERVCNNGVLSGGSEYTYSSCVKGEISNCSASGSYVYNGHTYNIPALNHNSSTSTLVSASVSENNGTFSYTLDSISCNDGSFINPSETSTPTLISCNSGYGANGNSCNLSQNGMCNNLVALGCNIGNAVQDNNQNACGTTRTWKCTGVYGGNESNTCSFINPSCQSNPSNLSLNHTTRNKTFTFSWNSGVGNSGSCKLQYNKNGTWTNISELTYNCDTNITNQSVTLPGDGWYSGNWNGVQVRVIRTNDNSILGTFSQPLNCSATSGSSYSTPNIDEDCNGVWDNSTYYTETYQSGTNSCGAYGTTYCHQYNPDGNCGHWVTPCIETPIYDYYYVYSYF